jgi:hypothetical protein
MLRIVLSLIVYLIYILVLGLFNRVSILLSLDSESIGKIIFTPVFSIIFLLPILMLYFIMAVKIYTRNKMLINILICFILYITTGIVLDEIYDADIINEFSTQDLILGAIGALFIISFHIGILTWLTKYRLIRKHLGLSM